jgi:hypothetical protein
MMYGAQRLISELEALGYTVTLTPASDGTPFAVLQRFVVPGGRFVDRIIDLGLQATPDFPRTVASAIHVRATPQLFEACDSQPNIRNITASALGADWRYWSHNFGWTEARNARRLISQINRIFANA